MDFLDFLSPLMWIPGVKDFGNKLTGSDKYDPARKAEPFLDKAREMYDPYVRQGQEAFDITNPIYRQMTQDPAAYMESLMKGYAPSKGYQMKSEEMLRAAGNSAAAGGMRGTQADMQNAARISDTLMGEDMQNWLNNIYGIQNTGLGGLNDVYNKGYGASSDIANIWGSQAGLGFQSQAQQNKAFQDFIQGLLSLGGKAAGGAMGGMPF